METLKPMVLALLILLGQGTGCCREPIYAQNPEPSWKPTWESANTAGMRAYRQGRYADAKQWFLQALGEARRTETPNPALAMTLNNLAAVHEALDETEDAELRYQQSLGVVETIQGAHHPDLVPGLNNLAALYAGKGEFARAVPLWRRSLTILESVLGENHPHLIPALLALAQASQALGNVEQADHWYAQALHIAEAELAADHPQTTAILRRYAAFLRAIDRDEAAAELEARIKAGVPPMEGDRPR